MSNITKLLTTSFIFFLILSSCAKDDVFDSNSNITTFKANLIGSSEVPSNTSVAEGTTVLSFDNNSKTFTAKTSYSGLIVNAGHIHMAAKGMNGYAVFPLGDDFSSLPILQREVPNEKDKLLIEKKMSFDPYLDGYNLKSPITIRSNALTDDQVKALFNGKMYVNLHSEVFPGGEIRGQLEKQ